MKQEGQPGSKTITTPITVNPLTGEKVGEGQPTEEITKQPVDKIVEFGGEKIPQGHKEYILIQTYQQIKRKKYQVNQVDPARKSNRRASG